LFASEATEELKVLFNFIHHNGSKKHRELQNYKKNLLSKLNRGTCKHIVGSVGIYVSKVAP